MIAAAAIALLLSAADAPRVATADRSVVDLKPEVLVYGHLYDGQFGSVGGVFCDPVSGEMLVADPGLNAIAIFDENGSPIFTFRSDKLRDPRRVTADREGSIYVLDGDLRRIKVFSYRGEFLSYLELPGLTPDQDILIGAIAFDADGSLYVGESKGGQIHVFGPDLKPRTRFGKKGLKSGQFTAIVGIALDAENVYVADQDGVAVQVFTKYGRFLRGWGQHEAGTQNVSLPAGIAVDPKGRIVLIDKMRQEVKYFEADGRFIDRFGGMGPNPGDVAFPVDVSIDRKGRLCVAEAGNRRVQVLSAVEPPPKPAPAAETPAPPPVER